MSEHNIVVPGGTSVRLPTAGKYCDRDIVIAAEGGGDDIMQSIVDRSIVNYNDDKITTIGRYSFNYCTNLESVNIPAATSIENYAFSDCTSLENVSCDLVKKLGPYCFYRDTSIKNLSFPEVITVMTSVFYGCSALTHLHLPKVTSIDSYIIRFVPITHLCFPKLLTVSMSSLRESGLIVLDLPSATSLITSCLHNCTSLKAIILRRTGSICSMNNTNALTGTLIESGTGYVYVPSSLLDSYKSATNWSTYASQFRVLEEYTVDGTITGAFDETKI